MVSVADTIMYFVRVGLQVILIWAKASIVIVMAIPAVMVIFRMMILSIYCRNNYPGLDKKVVRDNSALSKRWSAMAHAYDAAEGKGDVIEEEYFENCEWHIRALFEGERKMKDNQAKCEDAGRSNVCVSYHALSEDWSEVADRTINMLEKIIENEAVHAMLAVLTDKQRDLIHQQFVLGKTHQEIADDMGISRGSVTRAVNQALERIRRKFDFEAHYELAAGGLA